MASLINIKSGQRLSFISFDLYFFLTFNLLWCDIGLFASHLLALCNHKLKTYVQEKRINSYEALY
jgi:hypothetical protein